MHAKYKHPSELDLCGPTPHFVDQQSATIAAFDKGSVDLSVQENVQQEDNLPPHQQNDRVENRRGRRNKLYFLFGPSPPFFFRLASSAFSDIKKGGLVPQHH